MALSDHQRKTLIERINTLPLKTVLTYFQSGEITFGEVPQINEERKKYIEEQLKLIPNPIEQKDWQDISSLITSPSQELLSKINNYIEKWGSKLPAENHVENAKQLYNQIKEKLREQSELMEREDWNNIDPFSRGDLIEYLNKYPSTIHKNEIDESFWSIVNKENITDIQEYLTLFPCGIHVRDANFILESIIEWERVKNTNDIFEINNYLKNTPSTPFYQQAKILIMGLKQTEIAYMRSNPTEYSADRLLKLIEEDIATSHELILAGVITQNVLDTLQHTNVYTDLPDIKGAINNSRAECEDGFTDVFFFGVPSTGKTCVLMGLSRSNSLHIDLASGGGDYAAALQQYTDVGVTVPRTPGTFVTTLKANVNSAHGDGSSHKVNLVEMSGEEFAFGIANNPDHIFTFEHMGSGVTQLLSNNNRKVFFLIIDPTANVVRINREIINGYDSETGQPITRIEQCVVNQRTLVQKMVNLFQSPGNANIMKKVDSIHIIMTKSDTLGNPIEREERAYKIFREKYENDILEPIVELSKEYNINQQTNFRPKLYTFSLGTFYVGGLYEYEQTDSNRLVKAIRNSTHRVKNKTWWDRLKETVNK